MADGLAEWKKSNAQPLAELLARAKAAVARNKRGDNLADEIMEYHWLTEEPWRALERKLHAPGVT